MQPSARQVALPHYADDTFLRRAVKRYKMYLALKRAHPKIFLVPTYDMDFVWHAHQAHPLAYARDTSREPCRAVPNSRRFIQTRAVRARERWSRGHVGRAASSLVGEAQASSPHTGCESDLLAGLLGKMMNHDDSVNDRAEGSRLSNAATSTRQLWARAYGEGAPFAVDGAMYRGPPPPPVGPEVWTAVGIACSINHIDSCRLRLEAAALRGLPLAPPRLHPPSRSHSGGRAVDARVVSRPEPERLVLSIGTDLVVHVNRTPAAALEPPPPKLRRQSCHSAVQPSLDTISVVAISSPSLALSAEGVTPRPTN